MLWKDDSSMPGQIPELDVSLKRISVRPAQGMTIRRRNGEMKCFAIKCFARTGANVREPGCQDRVVPDKWLCSRLRHSNQPGWPKGRSGLLYLHGGRYPHDVCLWLAPQTQKKPCSIRIQLLLQQSCTHTCSSDIQVTMGHCHT